MHDSIIFDCGTGHGAMYSVALIVDVYTHTRACSYACNKPAPKLQGDLQAWRAALNNLRAQQEHQGNRLVFRLLNCLVWVVIFIFVCLWASIDAVLSDCAHYCCPSTQIQIRTPKPTIPRLVNMELLQTYAPDVWLLYNEELERFKGQLDKELEAVRKEADIVR